MLTFLLIPNISLLPSSSFLISNLFCKLFLGQLAYHLLNLENNTNFYCDALDVETSRKLFEI